MSENSTDSRGEWWSNVVERTIKQPVREAVRDALAEHDVGTAGEPEREDAATERDTHDGDETDGNETDGDATERATETGRPSGRRLLVLAAVVAGAGYVATRQRRDSEAMDGAPSEDATAETGAPGEEGRTVAEATAGGVDPVRDAEQMAAADGTEE